MSGKTERPTWLRRLCVGSTSELWLGRWRHSKVLLKFLSPRIDGRVLSDAAQLERRHHEAALHNTLAERNAALALLSEGECRHPDDVSDSRGHYLVLRHEDGISLQATIEWVERKKTFGPEIAHSTTVLFIRTLDLIHQAGLLHRDAHPRNFLASSSGQIKAFDLGYCAPQGYRPTDHKPRPLRHVYEAADYAAGLAGDPASDFTAVGIVGMQLLGVPPGALNDPVPANEALVRTFRELQNAKIGFFGLLGEQLDDRLRTAGLLGLKRPAAEPLTKAVNEPQDFLEVAACIDTLVYTMGFPKESLATALIAPSTEYTPAFGFVVKDPCTGLEFSIHLVSNCNSAEEYARRYSAWAPGFLERFTPGERETIFASTKFRSIESELIEAMQHKGLIIPRLGADGIVKSTVLHAVRQTSTNHH